MDSLLSFTGFILNFTVLAVFSLFCFKFIQSRKNSGQKNQIQNLNAKLSMLRMTLRSKLKTKSYKYRSLFRIGITSGDPIDEALNELIALPLENGDDLQRYFDISKKVNSMLITQAAAEAKKEQTAGVEPVGKEDFMGTDFKSEIAILRLIKEIVEVSRVINKRIENYNLANPKQPIAQVNTLTFPALAEVNRVFMNKPDDPGSAQAA